MTCALRVRWLGRVRYRDAHALQHGLFAHSPDDHLLLLEHPHVYTLGVRGDLAHVLVPPAEVGAELVRTDRGGDVTYHGPGQLVGYPILSLEGRPDTPAYVASVEQLVIDALADLGLPGTGRLAGYPGVWVDPDGPAPRKIAAVGVRLTRGRTMHGFALNVDPDLRYFGWIVPCGIADKGVTSMAVEGVAASMRDAVDAIAARAVERWARDRPTDRADVAWHVAPGDVAPFTRRDPEATPVAETSVRVSRRLAEAGVVDGLAIGARKPPWLRAPTRMGGDFLRLKQTMRSLELVTVCEEAGCPNIYECWADGTATFMICGERCTRACGFCLVDTRHPEALDDGEPARVAQAVARLRLAHAVVTMVARDDLADGGAAHVAATVRAIRAANPGTRVEVLVSDLRGAPDAIASVVDCAPDVFNHNVETVARLQRAVRPSASYARSLSVLARAKAGGLTTKSGLVAGMGETDAEIVQTLADLRGVGVDIVTIGQYLRPTGRHLPVARWVTPEQFDLYRRAGADLGIAHVESSPLTRSSYHAREAGDAAGVRARAGTA